MQRYQRHSLALRYHPAGGCSEVRVGAGNLSIVQRKSPATKPAEIADDPILPSSRGTSRERADATVHIECTVEDNAPLRYPSERASVRHAILHVVGAACIIQALSSGCRVETQGVFA